MLALDHVIYGTRDLDAAAERLRAEHGLGSVVGGRHGGGTVNRVVPLEPPLYLELLAVADLSGAEARLVDEILAATGGEDELRRWLGAEAAEAVPLRFVEGPPRIRGVGIETASGEIVLR
jgi:hypothetical protein